MNIVEAMKQVRTGGYNGRQGNFQCWQIWRSSAPLVVMQMVRNSSVIGNGVGGLFQPTAEDLLADDWVIAPPQTGQHQ